MAVDRTHNPQRGPAQALLELLTEHPNLPHLNWSIPPNDTTLHANLLCSDARHAVTSWSQALGCDPWEPFTYEREGVPHTSQHIVTTWRDVNVTLSFYSSVAYQSVGVS